MAWVFGPVKSRDPSLCDFDASQARVMSCPLRLAARCGRPARACFAGSSPPAMNILRIHSSRGVRSILRDSQASPGHTHHAWASTTRNTQPAAVAEDDVAVGGNRATGLHGNACPERAQHPAVALHCYTERPRHRSLGTGVADVMPSSPEPSRGGRASDRPRCSRLLCVEGKTVAEIHFTRGAEATTVEVDRAIALLERHTNRGRFLGPALTDDVHDAVRSRAQQHDTLVRVVDASEITEVEVLLSRAEDRLLRSADYLQELDRWVWHGSINDHRGNGLPQPAVQHGINRAESLTGREFNGTRLVRPSEPPAA